MTLAGAVFRVTNLSAWRPRPGTWCDLFFVPGVTTKTLHHVNLCWKCGVQLVLSLPAARYPERLPVIVDFDEIMARRHQRLAAFEGRPGQVRKSKEAHQFTAFAGRCLQFLLLP